MYIADVPWESKEITDMTLDMLCFYLHWACFSSAEAGSFHTYICIRACICTHTHCSLFHRAVVPKLFGTRDQFTGRQFLHRAGAGMVQSVMQAMGSDAERQRKLRSLTRLPLTSCCVAWFLTGPGMLLYWSTAWELRTPATGYTWGVLNSFLSNPTLII